MENKVVPLSASFMLVSILGALITVFYIFPTIMISADDGSYTCVSVWGCSVATVSLFIFVLFFIASLISMSHAPIESEFDIHDRKKK
jgi:hypothetical protein